MQRSRFNPSHPPHRNSPLKIGPCQPNPPRTTTELSRDVPVAKLNTPSTRSLSPRWQLFTQTRPRHTRFNASLPKGRKTLKMTPLINTTYTNVHREHVNSHNTGNSTGQQHSQQRRRSPSHIPCPLFSPTKKQKKTRKCKSKRGKPVQIRRLMVSCF